MTRKATRGRYKKPDAEGEPIHCKRCTAWIAIKIATGIVRRDGVPIRDQFNVRIDDIQRLLHPDLDTQLMTEDSWTAIGRALNNNRANPDLPLVITRVRCRNCRLMHWLDTATGSTITTEHATPELSRRLAALRADRRDDH